MKRKREQGGSIVKVSGSWRLRYREDRCTSGTLKRVRVSHYLGPCVGRGRRVPDEITKAAQEHLRRVGKSEIPAEHAVTFGEFVEREFLPEMQKRLRPSASRGYASIWTNHLKAHWATKRLRTIRFRDVQRWLNSLASGSLKLRTLRNIRVALSAIFTFAMEQDYFEGAHPVHKTKIRRVERKAETPWYTLKEAEQILSLLPEPTATAFAVATYAGLRRGEIEGLEWQDLRNDPRPDKKGKKVLCVSRAVWNGRIVPPKTDKSAAPVPVIPLLAERLTAHRLRSGGPETGPIFRNSLGHRVSLNNLLNRVILPTLNRCSHCGKAEGEHIETHKYERDSRLPEWKGWHAARRGVATNLYSLGVEDKTIQSILRHENVSTTLDCYVKDPSDAAQNGMAELDNAARAVRQQVAAEAIQLDQDWTKESPDGDVPEAVN